MMILYFQIQIYWICKSNLKQCKMKQNKYYNLHFLQTYINKNSKNNLKKSIQIIVIPFMKIKKANIPQKNNHLGNK